MRSLPLSIWCKPITRRLSTSLPVVRSQKNVRVRITIFHPCIGITDTNHLPSAHVLQQGCLSFKRIVRRGWGKTSSRCQRRTKAMTKRREILPDYAAMLVLRGTQPRPHIVTTTALPPHTSPSSCLRGATFHPNLQITHAPPSGRLNPLAYPTPSFTL